MARSIDTQQSAVRGFVPAQNDEERFLMRHVEDLARAAFGDAAADADILRAMAALTRCLFRRPAALPDHVALGSSAQALHWPPDAAGLLWSEEIDALRRELS